MSTKTRRRKKDLTKDNLARLAALNASAVTLMQKGVRSEQMISTMLHSLQLFKQKRLAGVVPIAKLDENELPENLQEILSL
ncbi:hypothetical protein GWN26_10945, partial [Candidatus Saccharibacteria bacterium]|nr:hypothetical protein [Candidatus Saccharibacteria bacterium]NIV04101.1 hypothetical protein [Calditrichia bacterium]NIS38658.1 hypothetical protein [Candidatus Saccharibacteria bacterium]NIV72500.1 hypothetical protein [Calditrichia bacterium]NIV99605.1 hypothetical protein [Candidatus Saccharibacteria bacterium]